MPEPLTNWAATFAYRAARVHRPSTVDELRRVVAQGSGVHALGTGHSFSGVADTTGDLVSVAGLPTTIDIDRDKAQVRVSAGTTYAQLAGPLHAAGFAVPNLASLPHISVAGACATGTHGSGDANGNLATAVSAIEFVTADGELAALSRGQAGFDAAVVSLGALGVVTTLTLDLRPAFEIRQYVYEDLPIEQFYRHHEEIFAAAYSVSVFTVWNGATMNQVWRKQLAEAPEPGPVWFGARLADGARHPVPGLSPAPCTIQGGEPGPWYERLPHFRPGFTPSTGEEVQSEYLIPRRHTVAALRALDGVADRIRPLLQISELRTVAADEQWLSPSYRRDTLAIHFTWVKDVAGVAALLPVIEERLAPFEPRPHWGKVFTVRPDVLRDRYQRWSDFAELLGRNDPAGRFRTDWLTAFFPS
jgi:xylitol oxidase